MSHFKSDLILRLTMGDFVNTGVTALVLELESPLIYSKHFELRTNLEDKWRCLNLIMSLTKSTIWLPLTTWFFTTNSPLSFHVMSCDLLIPSNKSATLVLKVLGKLCNNSRQGWPTPFCLLRWPDQLSPGFARHALFLGHRLHQWISNSEWGRDTVQNRGDISVNLSYKWSGTCIPTSTKPYSLSWWTVSNIEASANRLKGWLSLKNGGVLLRTNRLSSGSDWHHCSNSWSMMDIMAHPCCSMYALCCSVRFLQSHPSYVSAFLHFVQPFSCQ